MTQPLDKVTIRGFKSIQDVELQLKHLNILIGANGAGKSNFITLFRLLRVMVDQNLKHYIHEQGGSDSFFFNGLHKIEIEFVFGNNAYLFELKPTADEQILITKESTKYKQTNCSDCN